MPINWQDGSSGGTPLSAANLNRLAVVADVATAGTPTGNALRAAYGARSRGSLTIALGDSIDQGSDQQDYYSAGSIFSDLCILSNQRVKWLRNSGIGGNTTAQVLARVQSDAVAYNPGVVIIGGGVTNDHDQGTTPATTRANLAAIRDALWAAGITVVARNVPPCDNAGSAAPYNTIAARRSAIQQHNAWLRNWAANNGIPLLDYYTPLVNVNTGGYTASLTTDGTHPNIAGQLAVAQAVVNTGLPPCWTGVPQLATAVGDGADLIAGIGLFLGTPTNGIAAGWTTYGNDATVSLITDASIVGKWQQISGGTTSIHVIDQAAGIDGKWAVGDVIEFACRITKSGTTDSGIKLRFTDQANGNGNSLLEVQPAAGARAISGIAVGRAKVPTGAISGYIEMTASAGETIKFAQVTVSNLTALGAV